MNTVTIDKDRQDLSNNAWAGFGPSSSSLDDQLDALLAEPTEPDCVPAGDINPAADQSTDNAMILSDDDLVHLNEAITAETENARLIGLAQKLAIVNAKGESLKEETGYNANKRAWTATDEARKADAYETYNTKRRDDRQIEAANAGRIVREYVKKPDAARLKEQQDAARAKYLSNMTEADKVADKTKRAAKAKARRLAAKGLLPT